jgi:radical SAM protein (TIGR01212 family)
LQRYRDYNSYLKEIFGERVQKIPLDAGFSCPNRDGTISYTGCIYCNSRGSGTGAMAINNRPIDEQMDEGKRFAQRRYKAKKFIAYFQAFTNTHAPVQKLKGLYDQALQHDGVVGLSIGTRPDCIDEQILELISSYQNKFNVWIEFGLQSAHDSTLKLIKRGHNSACFEKAVQITSKYNINICAHIILGLPGENPEMMLDTARFLAKLPIKGLKIHSPYITKNTALAGMYKNNKYSCFSREEYVDIAVDCLELLPPNYIIQRLTGDPDRSELIAPNWALEKTDTLNMIRKRLEERDTWQGRKYKQSIAGKSNLTD